MPIAAPKRVPMREEYVIFEDIEKEAKKPTQKTQKKIVMDLIGNLEVGGA